jgi:hypothetical protein
MRCSALALAGLLVGCAHRPIHVELTVEPVIVSNDGPLRETLRYPYLDGRLRNAGPERVSVQTNGTGEHVSIWGSRVASAVCDGQRVPGERHLVAAMLLVTPAPRPLEPGEAFDFTIGFIDVGQNEDVHYRVEGHSHCVFRFSVPVTEMARNALSQILSNGVVVDAGETPRN